MFIVKVSFNKFFFFEKYLPWLNNNKSAQEQQEIINN